MSPRFAFGVLPLLIYETILCFLVLWKAMQNSGDGYGSSFLSEMVHDSIFTVLCLDSTLYCAPGACSSYHKNIPYHARWDADSCLFTIDRLPAHQREVKITTVTPALDEFYRFHTVIREQIGQ
ncbi:hypothetical protein BU17DRAFT_60065 [Hysterangium stoloniferum]|nr:hypothetical protein BU17DRAFT_60065 [Hysterangium stoloniferum]